MNARIQGCIGCRMQDAANASQPGGPSIEGPADIFIEKVHLFLYDVRVGGLVTCSLKENWTG